MKSTTLSKDVSKEKVSQCLNSIVEAFQNGNIPEAIALSTFPIANIPAEKWSLQNRILMVIEGTQDARGYKQWQEVGRHVRKGAKAFSILGPRFAGITAKKAEEPKDNDEPKAGSLDEAETIQKATREKFLIGFISIPVFKVEDTEGEPLDYEKLQVPELPLLEVAEQWGISVKAVPGNAKFYGRFVSRGANEQILLASEAECVFFHELAHAAHKRVLGALKGGQDWKQEIVAETSAAVLCRLVGKDSQQYIGQSYQYVGSYAKKAGLTIVQACLQVIGDVEKVLDLILQREEQKK